VDPTTADLPGVDGLCCLLSVASVRWKVLFLRALHLGVLLTMSHYLVCARFGVRWFAHLMVENVTSVTGRMDSTSVPIHVLLLP
jgi:hypothetical protein